MSDVQMHPNGLPFEETVAHLRRGIKAEAQLVKDCLKTHPYWEKESDGVADGGEMKANLTLAFRHLEDAAMRLGEVIQAKDGGKSVYDK
jgi:hypothetical protein